MIMIWNKEDIDFLHSNYPSGNKVYLIEKFGISWNNIKRKASKLKIKRSAHNLEVLLFDTLETFYWIGFLLADGHFCGYQIKLKLSIKDEKHLRRFGEFINCKSAQNIKANGFEYIALSASHYKIVPKICNKFALSSTKTYNPPDISKYDMS